MTAVLDQPTTEEPTIPTPRADADAPVTDPVVPETPELTTEEAEALRVPSANMAPEGIRILGYEVNWNVRGVLIARETLQTILTDRGLGDFLPNKPPAPIIALRRAIAEWANNRNTAGEVFSADDGEEVTRSRKLIREIRTKAENATTATIVLALVEEAGLGKDLSLKYGLSYRFKLTPPQGDATTWKLSVSTESRGKIDTDEAEAREDERRDVDRAIRLAWEKHRDLYNGADVSKIMIDCVAAARGFSVEAGTGVWSIPAVESAMVDRLENFVNDLRKTGTAMPHLRVRENIDWPRTRAALADAALDSLMAEVRDAENAIKSTEKRNVEKPGSVKITTLQGFVADLTRVRAKAAFYEETLGLRQSRVTDELTKLGTRAVNLARTNKDARQARDTPAAVVVVAPVADAPEREARESRETI